jgi:hypothetical protein
MVDLSCQLLTAPPVKVMPTLASNQPLKLPVPIPPGDWDNKLVEIKLSAKKIRLLPINKDLRNVKFTKFL